MLSKLSAILKSENNFKYTVLAKATDLALKFGILLFFVVFRSEADLVAYTYFLSLGAILSAICDWGGARLNVRFMSTHGRLPLNGISLVIAFFSYILIAKLHIVKAESDLFIALCLIYSLIVGWLSTFIKYYEYINRNSEIYLWQVRINLCVSLVISILVVLNASLLYAYLTLIFGNLLLLLTCLSKNSKNIIIKLDLALLIYGFPFLVNSLAVMAFSQINIVMINQFATVSQTAGFVLAQRLMEVSLMLPNSYTSSEIGRFFKGITSFQNIQTKVRKLWLASFSACLLAAVALSSVFEEYKLVWVIFVLLIPLGFVRSMSASYSIVLDYTKHYLVRTYAILGILFLNILLARYIVSLNWGIYWFCIFIGVLISILLIVYKVTFHRKNLYEAFCR